MTMQKEANRAVAGTVTKDPLVQFLDKRGTVIAASEPRLLEVPLSSLRPAAEQIATENVPSP